MDIKKLFTIDVWNVAVIESSIESIMHGDNFKIRYMKHNYRDRFFADPFLYRCDDLNYYILAEELKFYEKKGRIVLLTINRKTMRLVRKKMIIEEDYHLSYPFYKDGLIIPESFHSGCLYEYHFNGDCVVEKRLFSELPLIDATFLNYDGEDYIFGTMKGEGDEAYSVLRVFKKVNSKYTEQPFSPLKRDLVHSRCGGSFFEINGKLYRPVQNCESSYGTEIILMETNISENSLEEKEIVRIDASRLKKYNKKMHTFNVYKNFIVVDCLQIRKTPLALIFKKMKKICAFFDREYKKK